MKKLILITQDIGTLLRREKASLIIILLSLSLSICVSLTMVSFFSSHLTIFQQMRIDKSSYKLSFDTYLGTAGKQTPLEAFDSFFLSENSPLVIDSYYTLSFSTYPSNSDVITYGSAARDQNTEPPTTQHISWRAYFPDGQLVLLSEREEEKALLEGRLFSEEELLEGTPVAVVGRDSFPEVNLGDKVMILDYEIEVIGIRKEKNAIPYRLMQKLSNNEKGFIPDTFVCVFNEPLSEEQLDWLERAGFSTYCYFDIRKSGYYFDVTVMLLIIVGVLLLTVLNTLNMFRHLVLKARYRLMVMKVCGAENRTVFETIYLLPLLMSIVSSTVGITLYRLLLEPIIVREFQYPRLSFVELLIVFGIVLLLSFLTLLPTVRRMVKARPADMILWR